jgi:Ca2+-binding RTX toxin-like protein
MATHNKTGASPDTWEIDESNDTWYLGASGVISVGYSLGEAHGINEAADKTGNVINIKGDVIANGPWGVVAVSTAGQKTQVHVFENAKLVSDTGISSTSPGAIILNEGTIEASVGIDARDAKRITNAGDITGQYGIISDGHEVVNSGLIDVNIVGVSMEAGGTVLRNLKGGVIDATSIGVDVKGSGTARIVNSGEIIGGLVDDGAKLTLINRNRLEGNFDLGAGDDVFDGRGGVLDGQVEGGAGDDIFKISSSTVAITENFDEGYDKVISTATYNLPDFVEDLRFAGARNVDGTGNDGANMLFGNKGRNILYGNDGEDTLLGGRGNDRLFGGDDADIFEFTKRTGTDTIADFEDGVDLISSTYTPSSSAVEGLLKNHAEQKADDIVITYGDDRLIIRDMELNDLSKDDFRFL